MLLSLIREPWAGCTSALLHPQTMSAVHPSAESADPKEFERSVEGKWSADHTLQNSFTPTNYRTWTPPYVRPAAPRAASPPCVCHLRGRVCIDVPYWHLSRGEAE